MNPLVTVVVPFVNHRGCIAECLEETGKQSYSPVEWIFVDNGSQDGSDELVNDYISNHDGNIRLVREKIKGIPFARNRGLSEANGEFISFLDVDDRFAHNKIEVLAGLLKEHSEAGMAFGHTMRIYEKKVEGILQDPGNISTGLNFPPLLAYEWAHSLYTLPQTGATLARTEVARAVGGFPENMTLGNDDVGFHMNMAVQYPVFFHPFVAVYYKRHEKSEGSKLNRQDGVHCRYFDAYLKAVVPAAKTYMAKTGDIRLLGMAQRGMFLNFVHCRFMDKNKNDINGYDPGLFLFYKMMTIFYRVLPFNIAQTIYKVLRRGMHLLFPLRYPLKYHPIASNE